MTKKTRPDPELASKSTFIAAGMPVFDAATFMRGGNCLSIIEKTELTDVTDKQLLHLKCGIGLETLSWAREGAQVTGVDSSPQLVQQARTIAHKTGTPATFIHESIYTLPDFFKKSFDIVYSSYGALRETSDLKRWAGCVAYSLKRGGRFYMIDIHPVAANLRLEADNKFSLRHNYPDTKPLEATPADDSPTPHYDVGGIVTALSEAGLTITFVHEHTVACAQLFDGLIKSDDDLWRSAPETPNLPLTLSVMATRQK